MIYLIKKTQSGVVKYLDSKLTTENLNYKQVINIILPILVDQSFIVLFGVLNTSMISSAGVESVSAVDMVNSMNLFLRQMLNAIATGGTILVAQYKGINRKDMVSKAAAQSICLVTLISSTISIMLIIFNNQTLNLLYGAAEKRVLELGSIYLYGLSLSSTLEAVINAINGGLRGVGKSKITLSFSLLMNLCNVIFNLIFIKILGMGVFGLVIAICSSRLIAGVYIFYYMAKKEDEIKLKLKNILKIDFSLQRKLLRIGAPFAAEQMFFQGGKMLTSTFVAAMGTLSLGVNAISNSIMNILQCLGNTLIDTAMIVCGQCMGRREVDNTRKYIKSFVNLSGITTVCLLTVFFPMFPLLMKLYNTPLEIVPQIFIVTLLLSIAQPTVWGRAFIITYSIRAAGDSRFVTIASLASMWFVRVALGYILGVVLNFGIIGVWAAMVTEWCARATLFSWRLRGNKWYSHNLID